jgi:flagellin
MIINHNLGSMNANRNMGINAANANKSMEKLSSGLRINKAGDDAAGLAISEKMRGQIRGLDQASSNAQDGISLLQTAEGALSETHSILQRMRELSVQSASDTATAPDRTNIQTEVDQLAKEITRISNTSEFNTKNLLAGGFNSTFQIGANANQNLNVTISGMDAKSLGVAGSLVTTTYTGTNTGVTSISTTSESVGGLYVSATKTDAVDGVVTPSNSLGGTGTVGGSYSGSEDKNFIVKIGTLAAGKVTAASYSTDGGGTWTSAAVDTTGANGIVSVGDGTTLTIGTDATNNAVSDTYTFKETAEKITFSLNTAADGSGTDVGTDVVVHNNQSSVVLGDSASDRILTANFTFATVKSTLSTAGTAEGDQVSQNVTASTSAITAAGGSVSTDAVTQKGINVSSQANANNAITTINKAIETVSSERSKLGAFTNRLEHTIANLGTSSENLTSAESRIRDVDMAKEMSTFSKNNILAQAAQAMLAQANQQPQQVLQLLR